MKLSKAQLQYIGERRAAMAQREKDLRSFGDNLYKSTELCREMHQIYREQDFFNHMIKLHNVEIAAEKEPFKVFANQMGASVEEEFADGMVK